MGRILEARARARVDGDNEDATKREGNAYLVLAGVVGDERL